MRVISGTAKGRSLKAVPGMGTRPTTDKVKEAVFSIIGPYFEGGAVLDLFAGTGGLGIEALSRGMEHGVFIDADRTSLEVVRHNLQTTRLEAQAEVYRNDAERALKALAKRERYFRLVFLDPPYRMKTIGELMLSMHALGLLEEGATVVAEYDSGHRYEEAYGPFHEVRKAVYGDTAVSVYRYESGVQEQPVNEGRTEETDETDQA
ncbi:16S rRNA (guanine(966)-N(2))-methyltransferase RsmD [Gorillibacterium timonense]|uniref:16S rRNA (guanine(966)-N(2))-methyltransferase RsmD n=1 Tax=Gorillibacterium timonense TaxID=1689269 RepID=UPI00071DDF28|nr:16S rRNA (guanine(966)-N(2))-methyltransferase RsmD [Gorillibacterium timonense]